MTKDQALVIIIRDARSEHISKTSFARTSRALKALGLTEAEKQAILSYLDYIDCDTNEPYPRYVR